MAPAGFWLGNGTGRVAAQAPLRHLVRDHSQNRTVASNAITERSVWAHLSTRVATRLRSFGRPNRIAMRLRRLQRRLSYVTGFLHDFRPGMQACIPLPRNAFRSQSAS